MNSYVTYITIHKQEKKGYFMKVWLLLVIGVFIFSGCSTKTQNYRLRTMNAKQAAVIQKQQAQISILRAKLKMRQVAKEKAKARAKEAAHTARSTPPQTSSSGRLPKAPKKNIELKKVEDSNYSSSYMYPGANKKSVPAKKLENSTVNAPKAISSTMTKAECISMIGEEKFTKYTTMFGSESASLKRCKMLKAMKQ